MAAGCSYGAGYGDTNYSGSSGYSSSGYGAGHGSRHQGASYRATGSRAETATISRHARFLD